MTSRATFLCALLSFAACELDRSNTEIRAAGTGSAEQEIQGGTFDPNSNNVVAIVMMTPNGGVGICSPNRLCTGSEASGISFRKWAFQYHCSPGGSSGSNMLCSIGYGIGPTRSSAGLRKLRAGFNTCTALRGPPQ